jgi:hypothetical protein
MEPEPWAGPMNDDELDTLLAAADPAPRALPDPDVAVRRAIFVRATAGATHRRRRRVLIGVAAAALCSSAAATAIMVGGGRVEVSQSLVCADAARPDADLVQVARPDRLVPEACSELWRTGALTHPDVEPGAVPPLTGCVFSSGLLAVYPGDAAVCARLGLAAMDPDDAPPVEPDLVAAIIDLFSRQGCVTFDDAIAALDKLLLEQGAAGIWTTRTPQAPTPDRPCASPSIDEPNHIVTIVAIPEPPAD